MIVHLPEIGGARQYVVAQVERIAAKTIYSTAADEPGAGAGSTPSPQPEAAPRGVAGINEAGAAAVIAPDAVAQTFGDYARSAWTGILAGESGVLRIRCNPSRRPPTS